MRLLALVTVAFAVSVGTTRAQDLDPDDLRDEEARQVFEAGQVAYAAARYEDALEYFNRAFELSGRAELLFNIGHCADRLQRDDEAIAAFERYLREYRAAPNRHEVQRRIALLRGAGPGQPDAPVASPTVAEQSSPPAADTAVVVARPPADEPQAESGVLSKWWFWTIIGAVVVGAGVAVGVALSGDGTPGPQGDVGGVVYVLRVGS